jgi:hypothetical protein
MKRTTTLTLLFFFLSFGLFAQNIKVVKSGEISTAVEAVQEMGIVFSSIELIDAVSIDMDDDRQVVSLDATSLEYIVNENPQYWSLQVPGINDEIDELLLMEADIFAGGFQVSNAEGREVDMEIGHHYKGAIDDDPNSLASISIYKDRITGFIQSEGETWLIRHSEIENGEIESIIFKLDDEQTEPFTCATPDDGYVYSESELEVQNTLRGPGDPVNIYLEVDYDIYQGKGSGSAAYATGIFNESHTLYSNAGVTIALSDLVIWTRRSPYKGNSSSQLLSGFQKRHGSSGTWNGDLAHLISYRGGGGIAAGFSGLCNGDRRQSMCFSGVNSSYSVVPAYSWTVMVFTHEMGHLLGSRHTHACVWNGNGTAIDGCYTTEGGCTKPGIPEDGGTIMSYCHLTSAGINFVKGFHEQPNNVILNSIAGASCLGSGTGGNHCTNGIQDADETGVDCGGADCAPCPPPSSCDTPINLFASNIKGNRVKLNWDAEAGALSYDVQVRDAGGTFSASNTFNTGSNSISLRGFSVGAAYEWHVKTNCAGSTSAYSVICHFVSGDSGSGNCGTTLVSGATEFEIYPNPAHNQITVMGLENLEAVSMSVYDLSGKEMIQLHNPNTTRNIDVSSLNRGLYFLQVRTSDSTETLKFQLQ